MRSLSAFLICICLFASGNVVYGQVAKKQITIKKITSHIKVDGVLDDAAWAGAPVADKFVAIRPTPFMPETVGNDSEVKFLYNNEGIYVGGYFHENVKDSIASELIGRDGFGNNDFAGIIFDTYNDKLNGFEYFVTPLGEQMDAKVSPLSEDFSWNAVWQSGSKIQADGWTFEMFIPYSAIRFGQKDVQEWGLNIVRRRQKSGQQLFWQPIDPNVNGFLTQEGFLKGLENIKPPVRLQFSPYFSTYLNHDGTASADTKMNSATINGGMDVKYGINQAFTLDMTLIPDFGQVQTDNRVLNLSPFELRFTENRSFFTEGTELFNKGNLFYSRRIGLEPTYKRNINVENDYRVLEDPSQAKIINATKISGRTQKGLGVGILNALTQSQFTTLENIVNGEKKKEENMPLTNYNIIVLDQTLKHNSSISLVNTNVWRSGNAYDANVTSALFDLNNKKNTWNVGGNISASNILNSDQKAITGYAHSLYFGKTSGRLNFTVYQDLFNDKYDKSDLGYFTNNNYLENGFWVAYRWRKPRYWYNQAQINVNFWHNRLVTPIDALNRKSLMFQNMGYNVNGNAQTKKLWWFGFNININSDYNDFYEPRQPLSSGRVFRNKGSIGMGLWYESNSAKKFSWTANAFTGTGGVFKRTSLDYGLTGKMRFNNKFSVDHSINISNAHNQPGWAANTGTDRDTVIFSRRDVKSVENIFSVKYNFNNKMGLTLRTRHYWSKVNPLQFYQLDKFGDLQQPTSAFTGNVNQNYNFLSMDILYTWQFAQGSFINIAYKDISDDFTRTFEKSYFKNFSNTINKPRFSSVSVKVIYFLDYFTAKKKWAQHKTS
ncbi:MAG TPA: DUF5916 domain-containing protein [Ferruginibacter sp.]|nr:DUF5916 domain-containing protein [Ferruginibacter sp.]